MNTLKQALWLCLILIVLAYSGWHLTRFHPDYRLDNDTLSTTVDTTITHLTVQQFNTEGLLANILVTPVMEHIPKGDIHILQMPHILISQKDEPAWEINSLKARSFGGGEKIVFKKQVVVHQKPGAKTQESTLKTEEVTYYPKIKKASTNLFVTFEQPGNIVESTGMNAYLDEKRVELLHRARGTYDPKTKKA